MAKKQRKINVDSQTVSGSVGADNLGLERPYGSAPNHPNKYCLYISKGEAMLITSFYSAYAARKFLDILLEGDEVAKTRGLTGVMDTIICTPSMTKVRCDYIDELVSYEYKKNEEEWELNEPYYTQAATFRSRSADYRAPEEVAGEERQPRVKREKVEKPARPSKEGLITIQMICEEIKMEPREARSILRKTETIKPEAGWCWQKNEVDAIKTILHNNKE